MFKAGGRHHLLPGEVVESCHVPTRDSAEFREYENGHPDALQGYLHASIRPRCNCTSVGVRWQRESVRKRLVSLRP